MDCKYHPGNQPRLPMPKEGVGEDIKDESKAGPQTLKKALLICLEKWPRNSFPAPARVQTIACSREIQQARMLCIQKVPGAMVMDEL